MRKLSSLSTSLIRQPPSRKFSISINSTSPVIRIENGTFYREYPSTTNQDAASNHAMFPGLTWSFPAATGESTQQHWAVIGSSTSGKTTFFEIIRGQHLCLPPAARSFPYLSTESLRREIPRYGDVQRAIQYLGFDEEKGGVGKSGARGAYVGARYESRREATDFPVVDFLRDNMDLNPVESRMDRNVNDQGLDKVIKDLELEALINVPMRNLSNGQTRRARIARALLREPMILLLDEPFMGLDPSTVTILSPLLYRLSNANSPRLLLGLRPQDPLPQWITHVIHLNDNSQIIYQGSKPGISPETESLTTRTRGHYDVPRPVIPQRGLIKVYEGERIRHTIRSVLSNPFDPDFDSAPTKSREGLPLVDTDVPNSTNEALVEMQGVCVRYGNKEVLGSWEQNLEDQRKKGLWWTIRRGERWGIFGPNGSGKTTLVSLICSDHPQAYSLPIKIFGRGRLPQPGQPGISIFDIQSRIGQSSPEIHGFFPRNLSIRQTIESAWADTFLGTPRLTYENDIDVDTCLRWFEAELNPAFTPQTTVMTTSQWRIVKGPPNRVEWADNIRFGDAPFAAQRVALFLRAIIKKPDLVILDEAFSGMDDRVRDKCILFLTWGETQSFGIFEPRKGIQRSRRFVYGTSPYILNDRPFEGLSEDQALICISHVKEEVPGVVRQWMTLPAAGVGAARFGRLPGPLEGYKEGWDEIWGV